MFLMLLQAQPARASNYIAVDVPALQDAVVVVSDLYGKGEESLIFGRGLSVSVLADDTALPLIEGASGRVSALAVGDVNGDLRNELLVGTDSGGALSFYANRNGQWERQGQPYYLWETIRSLEVHDFNNDGWGDVLVLTAKGEAKVLLSLEGSLSPFWNSKAGEAVVGAAAMDIDHDGYPELIYALRSGYIAVLKWDSEDFSVLWENYPWGSVESLVLIPHQTSPEWLVVTSQKMLYGWRLHDGEVVSSRLFEGSELGENLFYASGEGILSFSRKTGISLFSLGTTSVTEKWRVPGLYGNQAFYHGGDFYFKDENNAYHLLVQGSTQWRVFLHEQEITASLDVLNRDGELFYCLPDLSGHLGLIRVGESGWHYTQDGHYIEIDLERGVVGYDGLMIPMEQPLLDVEGLPYISAEVFPLFGWRVELDPSRQHVVFVHNWGWWL